MGGGFGGVYTLKNLSKFISRRERKNLHITLIGEKNHFLFTPLLHEVATGGLSPASAIEPVRKVLRKCADDFYLGRANKINTKNKTVEVGPNTVPYDILVLALGAKTNFYGIPGAEENSFTLKSAEDALKLKNHIIEQVEKAAHTEDLSARKKALSFVIVGGGPTGVELSAEISELLKKNFSRYFDKDMISSASVTLVEKERELLPTFLSQIRRKSLQVLNKKGVEVLFGAEVEKISDSRVYLKSGEKIETETVVWVAGIKPVEIDFDTEVSEWKYGRLMVNKFLQLAGHENIFALGDGAAFKAASGSVFLPAMAQVAVEEARATAENISLLLRGEKMKPFVYRHKGEMLSLGQWFAVGEIRRFVFWGHLAWWVWRTFYLSKMISFRKKARVAIEWTLNAFSPRDISRY